MMKKTYDVRAVKFQRLSLGILLLIAFAAGSMAMVLLIAALMLVFAIFPPGLSPFYRLFFVVNPGEHIGCSCDPREIRFASILGTLFLCIAYGIFSFYQNNVAWILVLFVSVLSMLAGTSGFCLGSLIFVWLKRWF